MEEDLALTDKRYSWLLTIFYISYTVFEFQALMWKIIKPHQWAAFVVFSWYDSRSISRMENTNACCVGVWSQRAKRPPRTGRA